VHRAAGAEELGGIVAGQKVLIVGSSGGVGTFAVQLAKQMGAEVTAWCSARGALKAAELGADRVLDYAKGDFTRSGDRYDRILAVNGSYPLTAYRRMLAENGVCVLVGGSLKQLIKCMVFGGLLSAGGRRFSVLVAKPSASDLEYVADLVARGAVAPVIDRLFTLSEADEAIRYVNEGHARGKVVVRIDA
jgi:NADPH:quinone reductase-like Zn-dependent oxidoreductase